MEAELSQQPESRQAEDLQAGFRLGLGSCERAHMYVCVCVRVCVRACLHMSLIAGSLLTPSLSR